MIDVSCILLMRSYICYYHRFCKQSVLHGKSFFVGKTRSFVIRNYEQRWSSNLFSYSFESLVFVLVDEFDFMQCAFFNVYPFPSVASTSVNRSILNCLLCRTYRMTRVIIVILNDYSFYWQIHYARIMIAN